MKLRIKVLFLIAAIAAVSCASKPALIPENLTAAELVQRAQEASDRNRFAVSIQYYETILEKFPYDMEYICTAEYEIAFIQYKQKKYDLAKTGLNTLLERYNTQDKELLPPQYEVLAKKILGIISETENRGKNSK